MASSLVRSSCLATILATTFALAGAVACSSDPASPPGGGVDGGALPDGASGDATGPDGGEGGSGSCTATGPVTTLGTIDKEAFDMVEAGDYLVFRDFKVGLDLGIPGAKTGGLVRMPKAGGAAVLALAPSAADRKLGGFFAEGNTLYAIDAKGGDPNDTVVVRKTLPDGAVESLGITGLFDGGIATIVAADATNLYFRAYPSGGGAGFSIYRAPKAGGAVELVTKLPGANKDVFSVTLLGSTLWFTGIEAGTKNTFYTAPANGNDVAPTKIEAPNKCVGDVRIAASGIACHAATELKVVSYDPAFTSEKVLFDTQAEKAGGAAIPAFVDGTRVLITQSASTPSVPLRVAPIGGGPFTTIACDRARIVQLTGDATHYYWYEDEFSKPERTVYKMAK